MSPTVPRAGEGVLTIIVTGFIVRRPVGGLVWHYVQYVLGLKQMGHRVIYMEDSEDFPSCYVPPWAGTPANGTDSNQLPFRGLQTDPDFGLRFAGELFERLDLDEDWCYYDFHTDRWLGPAGADARRILKDADVLLNVSGSVSLRPWHMEIPRRVLIDTDPVFSQARHRSVPAWLDRSLRHNAFFTFGENFGKAGCSIPDDGLPWIPTRQPIALDLWNREAREGGSSYTTVMSWKSYDPGVVAGRAYGLKSDSFAHFLSLPQAASVDLEIALEGPDESAALLRQAGWSVVDALDVTRTPWTYQDYILASRGEFSVAKEAYAATHSGWFSERSAAYLASGRPVICQDTGFGDWIDGGEGLLGVGMLTEAVAAFDVVEGHYARHARAARDLAHAYFDAGAVLGRLIETIFSVPAATHDAHTLPGSALLEEYRRLAAQVDATVPRGNDIILLDENRLGVFGRLSGRRCAPFLERDGVYWGNPVDTAEAIRELERMRREGYSHLIIAEPARWWLDYYAGFAEFLARNSRPIHASGGFTIYELGLPSTAWVDG